MRWIGDAALAHLRAVGDEPDLAGTKYRLVGAVGRGGMGCVYVVEDSELGREVALKVTTSELADLGARLQREARVLARLEHPGIVPVHDAGTLPDGRHYYVMKLVRGEALDRWAKTHDRRETLRLFQRVCEAVGFAHAHGILHRDLKPSNVMVGEFGEALVMDWGIAKELGVLARPGAAPSPAHDESADTVPASQAETRAGAVMGTPAFMAPEQARGEIDTLDARADVYGLGAILYFLLAGRPPFAGERASDVLQQVIDGTPEPLPSDLPRPLAAICGKALAKDPADRYPKALELADDVGRFLEQQPVAAHRESPFEIVARFVSRHRVLLSLLAAYLLLRVALALM